MPVSMNLARPSLEIPYLLQHMKRLCLKYGVDPQEIELEITETSLLHNVSHVQHFIESAKTLGFRCAIDDFGVGYSSLGCLHELTVDDIKFDRSFFVHLEKAKSRLIVRSMARLAKMLGCTTVAEGIETRAQLDLLRGVECDLVQGFVFYRPMTVEDFEKIAFEA
ncbi:signaling protein [gut metagenome]|uniref:Signaling protein n=1 Tax=gut metagenome TaxID=749906 RepID=J9G4T2_9ZZZZ